MKLYYIENKHTRGLASMQRKCHFNYVLKKDNTFTKRFNCPFFLTMPIIHHDEIMTFFIYKYELLQSRVFIN